MRIRSVVGTLALAAAALGGPTLLTNATHTQTVGCRVTTGFSSATCARRSTIAGIPTTPRASRSAPNPAPRCDSSPATDLGDRHPLSLTGLIVQVEVAFHLFATVVRNVRLAGGTFGPQGVYPRPRLYDRAVMRVPGRVRVSESRQANFRKNLAVEHVRQLFAFVGERSFSM